MSIFLNDCFINILSDDNFFDSLNSIYLLSGFDSFIRNYFSIFGILPIGKGNKYFYLLRSIWLLNNYSCLYFGLWSFSCSLYDFAGSWNLFLLCYFIHYTVDNWRFFNYFLVVCLQNMFSCHLIYFLFCLWWLRLFNWSLWLLLYWSFWFNIDYSKCFISIFKDMHFCYFILAIFEFDLVGISLWSFLKFDACNLVIVRETSLANDLLSQCNKCRFCNCTFRQFRDHCLRLSDGDFLKLNLGWLCLEFSNSNLLSFFINGNYRLNDLILFFIYDCVLISVLHFFNNHEFYISWFQRLYFIFELFNNFPVLLTVLL